MVSSSQFVSENLIPPEVRHQFDRVPGATHKVVEIKGVLHYIMELNCKTYPPLASFRLEQLKGLKFPHAHTNRNGKIEWRKMRVISPDLVSEDNYDQVPSRKIVLEKKLHRHGVRVIFHDRFLPKFYTEVFKLPSLHRSVQEPKTSSQVASQNNNSVHASGSATVAGSVTSSKRL